MKHILFILLVLSVLSSYAQDKNLFKTIEFNGYAQVRASTNFDNNNGFALRRLKFWLKSKPGYYGHWSYKIQVLFSSFMQEKFFLQDVYVQYKWGASSIRFGQFVPRYSLQWSQPDYLIPALERARAINVLIPDGGLGVRDMGVQYNLLTAGKHLHFNVGLFNGFGIKTYRFNNTGFMITQNLSYKIPVKETSLKIGFSTMFRQTENLQFPGILPDSVLYSGNDFRFNIYAIFTSRFVEFQAEYLQANLEDVVANGYYGLATLKINKNNHAYLMFDQVGAEQLISYNKPWYIAGYNYFFKSYKIMLTFQTRFQQLNAAWVNRTSLQFQMFL